MSGITESTECKKCGQTAWKYYDWKPVELEIHECMNYECGFQYFVEDGIDKSRYMTKEEIKNSERSSFRFCGLLSNETSVYCSQIIGSVYRY